MKLGIFSLFMALLIPKPPDGIRLSSNLKQYNLHI